VCGYTEPGSDLTAISAITCLYSCEVGPVSVTMELGVQFTPLEVISSKSNKRCRQFVSVRPTAGGFTEPADKIGL
jgi:hypothetical protein